MDLRRHQNRGRIVVGHIVVAVEVVAIVAVAAIVLTKPLKSRELSVFEFVAGLVVVDTAKLQELEQKRKYSDRQYFVHPT